MKGITRGLWSDDRFVLYTSKVIPEHFKLIYYDLVYDKLTALRRLSYNFIKRNNIS